MAQEKLNSALAWAARGFRVFPLRPHTKLPAVARFYECATTDKTTIEKWWRINSEYNIGVATDGICVVDVDNKRGKNGSAEYARLEIPTDTLCVRTPTGGFHYYFSTEKELSNSSGKIAPGIDTRGYHGYVVAPGSVTEEGAYTLEHDAPVADSPEWVEKVAARKETKRLAENENGDALLDIARCRDWLVGEPVAIEGQAGDNRTVQVFARMKDMGLTQLTAFQLAAEPGGWNDRCSPPWVLDELALKAENAYRYAVGRPAGCDAISAHFADTDTEAMPPPEYAASAPRSGSESSIWIDHGTDTPAPLDWLIWGLLPARGVGVMLGASGSGKTFAALHLARCLATCQPFFGAAPDRPVGVALLAAEGSATIAHRMHALGEAAPIPLYARPARRLAAKDALPALVASIQEKSAESVRVHGVPVALVVLDTLSASGLVEDENDNVKVAEAMGALFKLSQLLSVFVLVTHHPPKAGKGPRGAGAFFNDADCVFEIAHDKALRTRTLALVKSREGPTKTLGGFKLDSVTVAVDVLGREVTSCAVREVPIENTREGRIASDNMQAVLDAIGEAMLSDSVVERGVLSVNIDIARVRFSKNNTGIPANKRSAIFAEGLAAATQNGLATLCRVGGNTHAALADYTV